MIKICIDSGHCNLTNGKRTFDNSFFEYEFNLDVSNRIKRHLDRHHIDSYIQYIKISKANTELNTRIKNINKEKPTLVVSVHANAFGSDWNHANGWEIYCYNPSDKNADGTKLAKSIYDCSKILGLKDRGIKDGKTSNFGIITKTTVPSVIIEHGFYTNKEELIKLKSDAFREQCAIADVKGILKYLDITWIDEKNDKEDKKEEVITITRALRKGCTGNDVKTLQIKLNTLKYNCGTPDGSFGMNTDKAVRALQKANKLTVDGSVGKITMDIINSLIKNPTLNESNIVNADKTKLLKYKTLSYVIVSPEDIQMVVANKKYRNVSSKTAINGTYFWDGNPNGIIVYNCKTLCDVSSHAWRGYGQGVLYYDGKNIGVKRVKNANELPTNTIWAIGGCTMISPYGYNPSSEGFNGVYRDILRRCNKTVIGAKNGQIYLITVPNITHGTLLARLREMDLDYAVSLDGSGSTVMKCDGKIIMPSKDNRTINNWVVVKE